jgi:hypothetical protein
MSPPTATIQKVAISASYAGKEEVQATKLFGASSYANPVEETTGAQLTANLMAKAMHPHHLILLIGGATD